MLDLSCGAVDSSDDNKETEGLIDFCQELGPEKLNPKRRSGEDVLELDWILEELDLRDAKKRRATEIQPKVKNLTNKQIELTAKQKTSKKITDVFAGAGGGANGGEGRGCPKRVNGMGGIIVLWNHKKEIGIKQREKAMMARLEINKVFNELLWSLVVVEMDKPTSVELLIEQMLKVSDMMGSDIGKGSMRVVLEWSLTCKVYSIVERSLKRGSKGKRLARKSSWRWRW